MIKIEQTEFDGIYKIYQNRFDDDRGFFCELFKIDELKKLGFEKISQQNLSLSNKGVIRGLHFQIAPFEQSKIITVLSGSVFDIALDIRRDSKTFLKVFTIEIDMDSNFSLLISKGFAHGFQALEDETILLYSVDNEYSPGYESGINIFSKDLKIKFPVEEKVLSRKDETLQDLFKFIDNYEKK